MKDFILQLFGKKCYDVLKTEVSEKNFKSYVTLKNQIVLNGSSIFLPKWTYMLEFLEYKIFIPFDRWLNRALKHNSTLQHKSYVPYLFMFAYRYYFCKKANITDTDYFCSQTNYIVIFAHRQTILNYQRNTM